MIQKNEKPSFNVNKAKIIRKNTEDMMFQQLRLKLPEEFLIARSSTTGNDFIEFPGFAVNHDSGISEIIIFERGKINYLVKYIFESFFPYTNDHLVKKILYTGIVLDTKRYYRLDIEVFQELILARNITLLQNEEENHAAYDFIFTKDTKVIEDAKQSFLKIESKDCFLPEETNPGDLDYGEKLYYKPGYDIKVKPNLGTRIFPTITSENYDFIKRDLVEKKLFRKFKLKRPKEKLVVNSDVDCGKIINYPGFDIIHTLKKTLVIPNDKELINYVFKFIYEMLCPREIPSMVNKILYKAIKIQDIYFGNVEEDDFEQIYPFMKQASYITLIHSEQDSPLRYLFTFVDAATAKNEDPANLNPLFLYDEDDNKQEDVDSIEAEFEQVDLKEREAYKHPSEEKLTKGEKMDLIPKLISASRFKLQALNDTLLESQLGDEKMSDTDDNDEEDSFDEETAYEGLSNEEIGMKRKERKFFKRREQYRQTVESLIFKEAREKGPVRELEEGYEYIEEDGVVRIVYAPVERSYKTRLGPALRDLTLNTIIQGVYTFPAYGDSDLLGFTLNHYVGYTVVSLNPELKDRTYLLKFLCSILLFKNTPNQSFEKTPYETITLDTLDFNEFSEDFVKLSLTAQDIKLV